MKTYKAAKRYARAIFALAKDENKLEIMERHFVVIKELLGQSPGFGLFLSDPVISVEKRRQVVESIFKKKSDKLFLRLLNFLAERKKLYLLGGIGEVFEEMYLAHLGKMKILVTSVHPLSDTHINAIKRKLKEHYQKDIVAETALSKDLIGGFVVQVQDRIYDHSIKSRLNKFRQEVINA